MEEQVNREKEYNRVDTVEKGSFGFMLLLFAKKVIRKRVQSS